METFTIWLSILTLVFVVQGGLSLYFVNWVLWRWNTLLTRINLKEINKECINTDSEE
jgi:hypothetical protein|tara:strand:+ start:3605 stop:3775 length:171 start_codon:yes stop_codon:yes gene_type:complete